MVTQLHFLHARISKVVSRIKGNISNHIYIILFI